MIIIGASGLIGRSLHKAAAAAGEDVIATFNSAPRRGLVHFNMVSQPLRSVVPDLGSEDVVYVLAAYTNPSWIYEHQSDAIALNLDAARRVIDDVFAAGARVIFMSSVEVFDGQEGNYSESSTPHPLNLYGRLKLEIEQYLRQGGGRSCIVRTGWNVAWDPQHRCVVKLTYESLLRPEAKMAHDNTLSVADIDDTAAGLLALGRNPSLRICHLTSTPSLVRTELAALIKSTSRFGAGMAFAAVPFSTIPYSEPRAPRSHLNNSLAVCELGMTFRPVADVVRQKVRLLDDAMAGGGLGA